MRAIAEKEVALVAFTVFLLILRTSKNRGERMVSTERKVLLGAFILIMITIGILLPQVLQPPVEPIDIQLDIVSEYPTGGFTFDVVVEDEIAYLSVAREPGPSELLILDMSDPSNPIELGSYDGINYPDQIDVVDKIVFITDRFGPLCIINATDPSNIEKIGEYAGSGAVYDIEVVGDTAFLADWNQGLNVLNITNLSAPELIGNHAILGAAIHLDIVGDLLYLSNHLSANTGLVVLNISDPTDPFMIDSYLPSDELWNPHVFGDYIYCGNHELERGDLIILDTSDPTNVSEVGQFEFGSSVNSVIIIDDLAYVAGGHHGFDLLDVRDPTNPSLITTLTGVESGRDLMVIEDLVYLACDGHFYIIQVTEL